MKIFDTTTTRHLTEVATRAPDFEDLTPGEKSMAAFALRSLVILPAVEQQRRLLSTLRALVYVARSLEG